MYEVTEAEARFMNARPQKIFHAAVTILKHSSAEGTTCTECLWYIYAAGSLDQPLWALFGTFLGLEAVSRSEGKPQRLAPKGMPVQKAVFRRQ